MAIGYIKQVTMMPNETHHVSDMYGRTTAIAGRRGPLCLEVELHDYDSDFMQALQLGQMAVNISPAMGDINLSHKPKAPPTISVSDEPQKITDHW